MNCDPSPSNRRHRACPKTPWGHLHVIPLGYSIDGSEPTDHPDGLYGSVVRAQFHVVSVPVVAVNNLRQCFARNGIEVERFILSPYAAALGTLDEAGQQYRGHRCGFGRGYNIHRLLWPI